MRNIGKYGLLLLLIVATGDLTHGTSTPCGMVDDVLGEWCTTCTADGNGGYFRCSISHVFKFCGDVSPGGYHCAETYTNSCGGTRTNYADPMDCDLQQNGTNGGACTFQFGSAGVNVSQPCP